MKPLVVGLALLVVFMGVEGVIAESLGPSAYLEFADSPFSSLSFDYFYLEDFEDGLFNVPGVTATTVAGDPVSPGPIGGDRYYYQ